MNAPPHPLLSRLPRGGSLLLTHRDGKLSGQGATALAELMREHIALMTPEAAAPYRKVAPLIEEKLAASMVPAAGDAMMDRESFNRKALHHLQEIERHYGRDVTVEPIEHLTTNAGLPPPPPRPAGRGKS